MKPTRLGAAIAVASMLALAGAALFAVSASRAGSGAARPGDEQVIWQYEQSIYAGRAGGSTTFYAEHAHPDYAGWPPQMPAPIDYAQIVAAAKPGTMPAGEKLTLQKDLIRVTRDGRVALSFYTTHRTARPGGAAVDEAYENIHVWVKVGDDWRLVGGMSRPVPVQREKLGATGPTVPAADSSHR
ncbi:MAG: DUF4440 domain-containing protein [Steroidobacteraceae bacterium]